MAIPVAPTPPVENGDRCQLHWKYTSLARPSREVFVVAGGQVSFERGSSVKLRESRCHDMSVR
jgi:hypothetical protein